jgi:hypothetical protein
MSAYIVDRNHIVYLVAAAMSHRLNRNAGSFSWYSGERPDLIRGELSNTDYNRAVEVANMLWMENVKSVKCRYDDHDDDNLPSPNAEIDAPLVSRYQVTRADFNGTVWNHTDPVQVLKSCDCYEYQSCEHNGWPKSEAHAFIEALRARAWHSLAGYDDAKWGAPEPMAGAQNLSALIRR